MRTGLVMDPLSPNPKDDLRHGLTIRSLGSYSRSVGMLLGASQGIQPLRLLQRPQRGL